MVNPLLIFTTSAELRQLGLDPARELLSFVKKVSMIYTVLFIELALQRLNPLPKAQLFVLAWLLARWVVFRFD